MIMMNDAVCEVMGIIKRIPDNENPVSSQFLIYP